MKGSYKTPKDYTKLSKGEFWKLFEKQFGHLMRDRNDLQKSLMAFHIECGPGWYNLIWDLTNTIHSYIKDNPKHVVDFQIQQIKEKYGGLRYYYDAQYIKGNFTDIFHGMTWLAETLSYKICEMCGLRGELDTTYVYVQTLCPACRKKRDERLKRSAEEFKKGAVSESSSTPSSKGKENDNAKV